MRARALSPSHLRLIAGAYLLALAGAELFEALTNSPVSLSWVSTLTVLVSLGIVGGIILLALEGHVSLRVLLLVGVAAFLATLGSGYFTISYPSAIPCGVGSLYAGFPFPWSTRWIIRGDPGCPAPLLPILRPQPLVDVFLTDTLFYLAIGISTVEVAEWIKEASIQRRKSQTSVNSHRIQFLQH